MFHAGITSTHLFALVFSFPTSSVYKIRLSDFTVEASQSYLNHFAPSIFADESRNAVYMQAIITPAFTTFLSSKIDMNTMQIVTETDITDISGFGVLDGFLTKDFLYLFGSSPLGIGNSGVARINLDFRAEQFYFVPNPTNDLSLTSDGSVVFDPTTGFAYSSTQIGPSDILKFDLNPGITGQLSPEIEFEVIAQTPLQDPTVQATTWLPDKIRDNIAHKYGYRFKAHGQEAVYLKNEYTTGDNPPLKVVSI